VSSIVDKEKLPPRLLHLLEGESLLNDASGLVMFRFATAAALTGTFSLADASRSFLFAVAGGVAAGFICLWIAAKALKILAKLEQGAAESQVLVIVLLPFMAYLLAERWHASGVLAAVVCGMYLGRLGVFRYLGVSARMHAASAWQMISFALNGAIFILLGLQLPAIIRAVPAELTTHHWLFEPVLVVVTLTLCLIALRYAFMLLGGVIARVITPLRDKPEYSFGTRTKFAASIAGVRGAVTLAGVLSLPLAMPSGEPFPARDLVIFLATGVILCWLAIATLLLPRLTKGLAHDGHEAAALELRRARIAAAQAAVARLEELSAPTSDDSVVTTRQAVADALIASYRRRIEALEEGANPRQETVAAREAELKLRKAAIDAEMDTLRKLLRRGEINDHTLQRLMAELTLGQATTSAKARL
jgi:Na+/H+ antiporter